MTTDAIDDIPTTVNELKQSVIAIVQKLDDVYTGRFSALEQKLDMQEQQLALLVQAYAEMATLIQTMMQVSIPDIDPKLFQTAMRENGREMLEVLRNGALQGSAENGKFYPDMAFQDNQPNDSNNTDTDS